RGAPPRRTGSSPAHVSQGVATSAPENRVSTWRLSSCTMPVPYRPDGAPGAVTLAHVWVAGSHAHMSGNAGGFPAQPPKRRPWLRSAWYANTAARRAGGSSNAVWRLHVTVFVAMVPVHVSDDPPLP